MRRIHSSSLWHSLAQPCFGLIYFFMLTLPFYQTHAQTLEWVDHLDNDGGSTISVNDMVVLPSQDIIVVGAFSGDMTLGNWTNSPFTLSSAGVRDIFVARYDNATGGILWSVRIGGTSGDEALAVTTDSNGDVYVTGSFSGTVDFGNGLFAGSNGGSDVFVLKLNGVDGGFTWVRTFGGVNDDRGTAITIDDANNVYIGGDFQDNVDFGGGYNLNSNGFFDVFLMKLTNTNSLTAVSVFGGSGTDQIKDISNDGNTIYTIGSFSDDLDLDPGVGTDNKSTNGGNDTYIQAFSGGNIINGYTWGKTFGGTGNEQGQGISVDLGSGGIMTTGFFTSNSMDLDPNGGVTTVTANTAAPLSGFIQRFDAGGNLVWGQAFGDAGLLLNPRDIQFDPTSNTIYTTGYFSGTMDFDPGAATANLTSSGDDIFIAQFNAADGTYVNATAMGGAGNDFGLSINSDNSGNIFTSGGFIGTVDFDPSASTYNYTASGSGTSGFLQKLSPCINPVIDIVPSSADVCEGETVNLDAQCTGGDCSGLSYTWDNSLGTGQNVTTPSLLVGSFNYNVTVTNGAGCTATASENVSVYTNPTSTFSHSVSACVGTSEVLNVTCNTGCDANTTYTWEDDNGVSLGNGIGVTSVNTGSIPLVGTNYYYLTITNSNSCTNIVSTEITGLDLPQLAITTADICEGQNISLEANCIGGDCSSVTYSWDNSLGSGQVVSATGYSAGSYNFNVTATNANTCTATTAASVNVDPAPNLTGIGASTIACVGDDQSLTANCSGCSGSETYSWSHNGATTAGTTTGVLATAGTPSYTVTVTESNTCTATAAHTITVNDVPSTTLTASPTSICEGETSTIDLT
ncbi:MAG: hypothetical protein MK212_16905, partial [Saprospiraceae bacterium]|nr:hypothetical protein [Saprospiraceae bacterium]